MLRDKAKSQKYHCARFTSVSLSLSVSLLSACKSFYSQMILCTLPFKPTSLKQARKQQQQQEKLHTFKYTLPMSIRCLP